MLRADTAAVGRIHGSQYQKFYTIADFGIGIRNIVYLGVQFIELIVRICTCPFLHQLTHFGNRNDLIQLLLGKTKGQSQICIRIHIGRQNVFSLFRV